ncbi:uncharacterized protein [Ptychodera flava]|uniref:uncharacterized protein n=1 Tax=Ptychodera flava TaxID=63121 RepID=UPI00396A6B1A
MGRRLVLLITICYVVLISLDLSLGAKQNWKSKRSTLRARRNAGDVSKSQVDDWTCSYGELVCVDEATCEDLEGGGFVCRCPEGFEGDGQISTENSTKTGCQPIPNCQDGELEIGTDCYVPVHENKTWQDARTFCQSKGDNWDLAAIHSEQDFIAVRNFIKDTGQDFWIGLTDEVIEGIYVWSNGDLATYMNWDRVTNKPDDPGHVENCVAMAAQLFHLYDDLDCDTPLNFVCHYSTVDVTCPRGWVYNPNDDKCYFYSPEPVTLLDAYLRCRAHDSDLVSISSLQDQNFVDNELVPANEPVWLGLTKGLLPTEPSQEIVWTDGSDYSFTKLPQDAQMDGIKCVISEQSLNEWAPVNCGDKYTFICEEDSSSDEVCPGKDTLRLGDMCYTFGDTPMNANHSELQCLRAGAEPIKITDRFIQAYIVRYITHHGYTFNDFWIGLSDIAEEGVYRWYDDSIASYYHWVDGEPTNEPESDCVKLDFGNDHKWNDEPCSDKYSYICQFESTPCEDDTTCHSLALCSLGQCRCIDGYHGDGRVSCENINECTYRVCSVHADCTDTIGSYNCTCHRDYEGDGVECHLSNHCESEADCHVRADCIDSACICKPGYEGDGKLRCANINECKTGTHNCTTNATCTDSPGSFSCECDDGFTGDGVTFCRLIPRNCDAIKQATPAAPDGQYAIDPDGPGGLPAFTVLCDMSRDIGVVVIPHDSEKSTNVRWKKDPGGYEKTLEYQYTEEQIEAIIEDAGFCYQNMRYGCRGGAKLLDGFGWWVDRHGNAQHNWGGATEPYTCGCGEVNGCLMNTTAQCNCNGVDTGTTYVFDDGKIIDKDLLPIESIHFGDTFGRKQGQHVIGSLLCGPYQFDIWETCEETRLNTNFIIDGSYFIDTDGPFGEPPELVNCDMTTYDGAVTIMTRSKLIIEVVTPPGFDLPPEDDPETGETPTYCPCCHCRDCACCNPFCPWQGIPAPPPTLPPLVGPPPTYKITYITSIEVMLKLIASSQFCSQEVKFNCRNSKLFNFGEVDTYWTNGQNDTQTYWGGAFGEANMCGCGLIGACDLPDYNCNCDIEDDQWHSDFGLIMEKDNLPVTSVTVGDVGGDAMASFEIGELKCSNQQFGLLPSCQEHRDMGAMYSGTYVVDPDGPPAEGETDNRDPFLVYCEMYTEPNYGITIIGHNSTKEVIFNEDGGSPEPHEHEVEYSISDEDIQAIIDRSAYCVQEITYSCSNSPVHYQGSQYVYWTSSQGQHFYLDGADGDQCACASTGDCAGGVDDLCNCDAGGHQTRVDSGFLTNKDHLSVRSVTWSGPHANSEGSITIGKLKCWETWPTCADHQAATGDVTIGQYVIDPDGHGGELPFEVRCEFPRTIVVVVNGTKQANADNPDHEGPGKHCVEIQYEHATLDQIKGLTEVSDFCKQYAKMECRNAPFVNDGGDPYAFWYDSDNNLGSGWAGSADGPFCACGETGSCSGGAHAACNCDMNDDELRKDHGEFVNKDVLPISEICIGVSEKDVPGTDHERKLQKYTLDNLVCGPGQFDMYKDCQERRSVGRITESEAWVIDPDGDGPTEPFPVYCEMSEFPPLGVTIVHHGDEGKQNLTNEAGKVKTEYKHATPSQLEALANYSTYCTQFVSFTCKDAILNLNGGHGLYDRNGVHMLYWAGNTYGVGCAGGDCKCSQIDGDTHVDHGLLLDKDILPVSEFRYPAATGNAFRQLKIGPLRCSGLLRNCHEILVVGATYNPNGDNTYAIDPDLDGPIPPFQVYCDFTTDPEIGISEVRLASDYIIMVAANTVYDIEYEAASNAQIQALAQTSQFCYQPLQYQCQKAHLINDNSPLLGYFTAYNDQAVTAWAGAESHVDVGCACQLINTCPEDETCHCDALSEEPGTDGGLVIDIDRLPVASLNFGDIFAGGSSSATASIGDVRCGPKPFDIPASCYSAYRAGYKDGEVLIQPSKDLDPFLVECYMDYIDNVNLRGMTIIHTDLEEGVPIPDTTSGPVTVTVNYLQASYKQVDALARHPDTRRCYLAVKFDCLA